MVIYCYRCHTCGSLVERPAPMGQAKQWVLCPNGHRATRSWADERKHGTTDPELCTDDYTKNCEQRRDGLEVTEPTLAKSLARVPGVPKVRGADGRVYAAFRNRAHRRKILDQVGINE